MRVSSEGLIRLTLDELLSLPIRHHFSGLDEPEVEDPIANCGRAATLSGYTEWVTGGAHPVSLGWDWRLDIVDATLCWRRADLPRGNVLIVSSDGRDLAWDYSQACLGTVADSLPWPGAVQGALSS